MDLVKVAFKNVTDNHQVEGDTIFHKLVSDCFDVGEIFFNIDKLSDKLRIIAWDRQNDLKVLLDSNDSQHRLLGETLKLYMEQDAQAFNFKNLQRIYLLDYIGPNRPAQMNIIGGTSPITLFSLLPIICLMYLKIFVLVMTVHLMMIINHYIKEILITYVIGLL